MIVLNGDICAQSVTPFNVADRGLTLADGLFETFPVVQGVPLLLERHLARLQASALRLKLPVPADTVRTSIAMIVAGEPDDCIIRVTVTRGAGQRGLALPEPALPQVLASSAPWTRAMTGRPVSLATVSIRRNATSPAATMKTLAYLDNVMALDEARGLGADDALMLGGHGRVCCTSMANLFVVKGRTLATPPASDGILPGIMRGFVMENAAKLELEAVERTLSMAELLSADEVFATNSVRLAMPVTAVDGQVLPGGTLATRFSALLLDGGV